MIRTSKAVRRRGSILPMLALTCLVLFGFAALAIDIGLIAIARTQCQNAADCSALAAARTLSGDPSNNDNFSNCEPAARRAASANQVLGSAIDGSDTSKVTVEIGAYSYNAGTGVFEEKIPKRATDPYSLVRVTLVSSGNKTFFGNVFGMSAFNTGATATAAHRPRDIALIVDLTGSMRYS